MTLSEPLKPIPRKCKFFGHKWHLLCDVKTIKLWTCLRCWNFKEIKRQRTLRGEELDAS